MKYSENAGAGSDPDATNDEALITIDENGINWDNIGKNEGYEWSEISLLENAATVQTSLDENITFYLLEEGFLKVVFEYAQENPFEFKAVSMKSEATEGWKEVDDYKFALEHIEEFKESFGAWDIVKAGKGSFDGKGYSYRHREVDERPLGTKLLYREKTIWIIYQKNVTEKHIFSKSEFTYSMKL